MEMGKTDRGKKEEPAILVTARAFVFNISLVVCM